MLIQNCLLKKDVYYQEGAYYDFEKMKLFGPKNYDKYLSHFYGDYMTPPLPDKRKTSHQHGGVYIID